MSKETYCLLPPVEPILTRSQLAEKLGVSYSMIGQMMRTPGFPVLRLGTKSPRFLLSSVLAMLEQRAGEDRKRA